jgi:DNA cross-link repair 1A protein
MNSSDICHQVSDCPGLFVDAFRGHFLREDTKNPDATFILSHYHGDHYTQLPRDNKYRGPAKIHCTPITARLLIDVHLVSKDFVMEHEYGSTFRHRIVQHQQKKKETTLDDSDDYANITFYDANHCPGACIIFIELPDGKTAHLHTGDMRYHPRFQSYPLLSKSTKQRKIDLVYLDTTYCHPKHDFLTQEDAVNSIASQTQQLLSGNSQRERSQKTLVLLSCYSIGKEKVLYEASKRSEQLIYVSEKKWKMLRCIQEDRSKYKNGNGEEQQHSNGEGASSLSHQHHTNILERCTRDPSESDLHVISMGLAGEMWPYFQPNFQNLAKYVEDMSSSEAENNENETTKEGGRLSQTEYDKVVAFIPTGWADASNWNKKNAISTKIVQLSSSRSLHVEVRLISYSEHSTFPELVSFVQYLKPRKIIPTVYSDQSHKRQIEGRFRNMLDSTRAKQAFFRSMTKQKNTAVPINEIPPEEEDSVSSVVKGDAHSKISSNGFTPNKGKFSLEIQLSDSKNTLVVNDKSELRSHDDVNENVGDSEEITVLRVVQAKKSSFSSASIGSSSKKQSTNSDKIDMIVSMGFARHRAEAVLEKCNGNMQQTIHEILSEKIQTSGDGIQTKYQKQGIDKKAQPPHSAAIKKRKISDFFAQKKK